jgi:MFS superfamily sulfate permease-like transporter
MFFTGPLSYVPIAALGAVLVNAALHLFNVRTLQEIWGVDRRDVYLSVLTTLGVVAVGAINAIMVAVALALLRFVKLTARPRDTVLGEVPGLHGLHALADYPEAHTWPGLMIYRFDGPITFFNSSYFREQAARVAADARPDLRWFVLDLGPVSLIDVTGMYAVRRLREELESQGVKFSFAGRRTQLLKWAEQTGQDPAVMVARSFVSVEAAAEAFLSKATP